MASKRALIVDDSTTAQYRLKKMLRAYPLDIDIVDSGEAALRYLAHHSPDVIFMDHLMPGMDGFRALQIIKSHPETAMIPVIMYTSKSGDVYTGQARALGALDVVSKDKINATDLSRVMETIHIYPLPKSAAPDNHPHNSVESPELIAAANKVTASANSQLERRAPNQAAMEQARNIELRLSHMEHSLEDNRRFITSRVSRELQGLRQNLRQEFSDILQQQTPPAAAEPAAPVETTSGNRWVLGFVLVIGVALSLYFLLQIKNQLGEQQQQQQILSEQLQSLLQMPSPSTPLLSPQLPADSAAQPPIESAAQQTSPEPQLTTGPASAAAASDNYLEDLAWTFNQQGALAFRQYTIDTGTVLRLHELLHRLASRGFKGMAVITIYVGDFCIGKDKNGMDQLAADETSLSNCMLSSELYGMDRLRADYARETEMILRNLTGSINSTLSVDIHAMEGTEPYPERLPTFFAGEWNAIAQKNNRIELVLVEAE
uniref:response regulator n=1 Tax=Cellvibrio fontiphilus TaxID=1815559 RepID=UPI002B4C1787|nr:response regulator [Cellvibrio fontiphilus]